MQINQWHIQSGDFKELEINYIPDLTLVFGGRKLLDDQLTKNYLFKQLRQNYVTISTAGEIYDSSVHDESLSITAFSFAKTDVQFCISNIKKHENSFKAGEFLIQSLPQEDLRHILLFGDGTKINGTQLVEGLNNKLKKKVSVTGGLAGDHIHFKKTLVGLNRNIRTGNIVAIGLYGSAIEISHGSKGGWDSFGPDRLVTKSKDNILYTLDDKPALDLYKRYLGDLAAKLPGAALLFPLSIRPENGGKSLVRTILSVNEKEKSMTFAGDIPEGRYVRLMKANFDRLIDAASDAALNCNKGPLKQNDYAMLISCVGRRLALNQRVDEELESVKDVLGDNTFISGFYSYGEISPQIIGDNCDLLNQTMTITTFSERE